MYSLSAYQAFGEYENTKFKTNEFNQKEEDNSSLVAHDNRKQDKIDWVGYNWQDWISHNLICTGTSGAMVSKETEKRCIDNNMVPPKYNASRIWAPWRRSTTGGFDF